MQPPFSLGGFVESLRRLIISHGTHDDLAFRENAETLVRELSVTNRPGEAKALRDALNTISLNGKGASLIHSRSVSLTNRSGETLVTFWQPKVSRESIVLAGETAVSIEQILIEHKGRCRLQEAGLQPKSRLLFWGPPGCGKTKTAELIASELGYGFGVMRLSSIISSFVGETASNLQKVFNLANSQQMVLLLDEADAVAKNRDDRNDVGELKRVVNSLLQCLDGLDKLKSIVIFASNHQHLFDSAVWRRFDDVVEFPKPSESARFAQLTYLASGLELRGSLKEVAKRTSGSSFAEIERGVLEIAKLKVLSNSPSVAAADIVTAVKRWHAKHEAARRQKPQRA